MTSRTPWEDVCAHWVRCDPQAFLDILFHQAVRFCHELPREQEVEKYEVDGLMEVKDLQTVGLAFAALKLQRDDPAELEWLQGRFYNPMLQEILRESPFIQWFIADEREKGLEEGLEKGREEGRAEGQAEIVEQIVRLRFPELVELSQQCLAGCSDLEKLGQVAVKLAVAQQVEEARKALLGLRARPKRGKRLPPS